MKEKMKNIDNINSLLKIYDFNEIKPESVIIETLDSNIDKFVSDYEYGGKNNDGVKKSVYDLVKNVVNIVEITELDTPEKRDLIFKQGKKRLKYEDISHWKRSAYRYGGFIDIDASEKRNSAQTGIGLFLELSEALNLKDDSCIQGDVMRYLNELIDAKANIPEEVYYELKSNAHLKDGLDLSIENSIGEMWKGILYEEQVEKAVDKNLLSNGLFIYFAERLEPEKEMEILLNGLKEKNNNKEVNMAYNLVKVIDNILERNPYRDIKNNSSWCFEGRERFDKYCIDDNVADIKIATEIAKKRDVQLSEIAEKEFKKIKQEVIENKYSENITSGNYAENFVVAKRYLKEKINEAFQNVLLNQPKNQDLLFFKELLDYSKKNGSEVNTALCERLYVAKMIDEKDRITISYASEYISDKQESDIAISDKKDLTNKLKNFSNETPYMKDHMRAYKIARFCLGKEESTDFVKYMIKQSINKGGIIENTDLKKIVEEHNLTKYVNEITKNKEP